MKSGKIPNDVLDRIVLKKINTFRKEVILRPGIGEDCAAIDFGQYSCVLSTDPITGASKEVGRLAVHISCNDIASCGIEPLAVMVTILCPEGTTEQELEEVMQQIVQATAELNVEIIGGHTEITPAVNRLIISTTCIGKAIKESIVSSRGAKPGDCVIMTKSAGLEGTAIIANDFEDKISKILTREQIQNAKDFINAISVVKEGILAGNFGATSMHDITEGGILGAAWEIAEASGTGITLYKEAIPVHPITQSICDTLDLDALKLISSGCMLITCGDGEGMVGLLKANEIPAAIIGKITPDAEQRLLICDYEGSSSTIASPSSDELYKLINQA